MREETLTENFSAECPRQNDKSAPEHQQARSFRNSSSRLRQIVTANEDRRNRMGRVSEVSVGIRVSLRHISRKRTAVDIGRSEGADLVVRYNVTMCRSSVAPHSIGERQSCRNQKHHHQPDHEFPIAAHSLTPLRTRSLATTLVHGAVQSPFQSPLTH